MLPLAGDKCNLVQGVGLCVAPGELRHIGDQRQQRRLEVVRAVCVQVVDSEGTDALLSSQ